MHAYIHIRQGKEAPERPLPTAVRRQGKGGRGGQVDREGRSLMVDRPQVR